MDSATQPETNRRGECLESLEAGGCDITSVVFQRRGQFGFDFTVRGHFVPPKSLEMDPIPHLELPEPAMDDFPPFIFNETANSGIHRGFGSIFPPGPRTIRLEEEVSMAVPRGVNEHNSNLETTRSRGISANFGFNIDFAALHQKNSTQTDSETRAEVHLTPEHDTFINGCEQNASNVLFNFNRPHRNNNISQGFQTSPNLPTLSHENFLPSNFNYLYDINPSPTNPSTSADTSFSYNEINTPSTLATSDHKVSCASVSSSSSSNLSTITSPSTSAATPSTIASSPEGYVCRFCLSMFTRPGDLKRHEGVHVPGRRIHQCNELGCERRGRKGFYRRDKLKSHQRQAHGMDV